jgi:hypothetical protein
MSRSTLPPPPEDNVPDPDAEPTAAEKAQARALGDLIDKAMSGRTPPAMSTSDRELLEIATVIRAVAHPPELSDARTTSVVEAALKQAIGGAAAAPGVSDPGIVAIDTRPRARASRAPWIVAGASTLVAAAAVIMLIAGVGRHRASPPPPPTAASQTQVPLHWRSRSADELIGAIPRDRSGQAAERLDAIFADRLDGFRERTLAGKTHGRAP